MTNQIKEADETIQKWHKSALAKAPMLRAMGLVHDIAAIIDIWNNFKNYFGTTEVLDESTWVTKTQKGGTSGGAKMGALFNKVLNDLRKETGWPVYKTQEGGHVHKHGCRTISVEHVELFRKLFYRRLHTFKNEMEVLK